MMPTYPVQLDVHMAGAQERETGAGQQPVHGPLTQAHGGLEHPAAQIRALDPEQRLCLGPPRNIQQERQRLEAHALRQRERRITTRADAHGMWQSHCARVVA